MAVDWSTATDVQLAAALVEYVWGDTITRVAGLLGNADYWSVSSTGVSDEGWADETLVYHAYYGRGFQRTSEGMMARGYGTHITWLAGPVGQVGWMQIGAVPVLTEPQVVPLSGSPMMDGIRALYVSALTIAAPDGPIPSV